MNEPQFTKKSLEEAINAIRRPRKYIPLSMSTKMLEGFKKFTPEQQKEILDLYDLASHQNRYEK